MFEYKIEGGYPVRGTIRASGNKNAALPCIAARSCIPSDTGKSLPL